eukprot:1184011-Prorocentrum_minimum.AAC.2
MHHFCGFFKQSSEDDPEDASFVPKYHGLIPVRNSNCTQTVTQTVLKLYSNCNSNCSFSSACPTSLICHTCLGSYCALQFCSTLAGTSRGGPEGVQRGSRGGPEGVQRGSRGGPEGVQRGSRGGPEGEGTFFASFHIMTPTGFGDVTTIVINDSCSIVECTLAVIGTGGPAK